MRNNVTHHDLTVTAVLRSSTGQETPLAPVTIPPQHVVSLNLRNAVAAKGSALGPFGSVVFRFDGLYADNLFAATIVRREGQPIDFHFDADQAGSPLYSTDGLEGMWWVPAQTSTRLPPPEANGIRGLVGKNDWPRYTEEEPEIYEQAELDKLFKACGAEQRLWYEFFLMTGMREQEVIYTYWSDINFAHATVRVSHKPDRGWTPKAYKEREIPIPEKLVKGLKSWKAKSDKTCSLVFPTAGCNPKLDFLDCLKAVTERAKLGEGDFWLHKFRATFATRCLWAGVDLRTVQQWLGHSDIESTMRYLKPSRSQHVRDKVNEIFA
jgi:hypothetical protein